MLHSSAPAEGIAVVADNHHHRVQQGHRIAEWSPLSWPAALGNYLEHRN